jgi:DNA-directed RNA polymerase omega subunit
VNKFEFVILSGARAKQLLKGCTPRTIPTGNEKPVRLAMKEVKEQKVEAVKEAK